MNKTNRVKPWSAVAEMLLDLGGYVEDLLVLSANPRLRYYGLDWREELAKEEWRKRNATLSRMQRQGLVKKQMNSRQLKVAVTKNGLEELARVKVLRSELLPPGKVCIVVFDIPEQSRTLRNKLRNLLRNSGFISLQRSVWYSPFDVRDTLGTLLKLTGMQKWVKVYLAEDETQQILAER